MKPSDIEALKRRQKDRVRRHTLHYVDGQPSPEAQATLAELGVPPAFVGESMRCEICGRVEVSCPEIESDWRALDVDGVRSYFCADEFPPDPAGAGQYQIAYQRALIFAMARRDPKLRDVIRERGLDRPIDWRA